ncbi:hypothetical protein ACHQM5_025718 [Ranunculus cassubicifolius]
MRRRMAVVVRPKTLSRLVLIASSIYVVYLILSLSLSKTTTTTTTKTISCPSLNLQHLVFGIASSSSSYPNRQSYIRTWWQPGLTRGYVFLDRKLNNNNTSDLLPPILISEDTSRFPYSFPHGLRSAIRITRIVKEIVHLNLPDVRWFVFGDDDTVFFTHNLLKVLSKYDHNLWYYVGTNSESFAQNRNYSFDMAFGGAGFAITFPLATVLATVLDSCLFRYHHLYGSDSRIFSCLAELGVALTHQPGFHQVDMRGDLFGMLSAHPLTPLLSLHHLDSVRPIFPGMNHTQALEQFLLAVRVDSERILQQTVCYDRSKSLTISVSWGYSVQVFEGNQLLPDLLPVQRTFIPWRRGLNINLQPFMFNVRDFPRDPCKRPAVFFLENVSRDANEIRSKYRRHHVRNCLQNGSSKDLEQIEVITQRLDLDVAELQAPRRHCCEVLSSFDTKIEIGIRHCRNKELIMMNP